jgi:hypothetical protein
MKSTLCILFLVLAASCLTQAGRLSAENPEKFISPVEAIMLGHSFPVKGDALAKVMNETFKQPLLKIGGEKGVLFAKDNPKPGVYLMFDGDETGLKRVDFSWTAEAQSDAIAASSLDVMNLLINDKMQPFFLKREQPAESLKAEKLKVTNWIYGPAVAALDAAAKQSPRSKQTDTIRTTVSAIFYSVRIAGRVSVDERGRREYGFVFTPGFDQTGAMPGDAVNTAQ